MSVPLVTLALMVASVGLVTFVQFVDAVVGQVHVTVAEVLCRI